MSSVSFTHWLAVGELSEIARLRIKSWSGFIRKVENEQVTTYLVGIPCQLLLEDPPIPEIKVWMRGKNEAIIEVPSTKLKLSWVAKRNVLPMYASVNETTLDVYQEDVSPMAQSFREAAQQRSQQTGSTES